MSKQMCKKLVGSVSVTVAADALIVNIPEASYDNCEKLCVFIAQPVPVTATRGLPVVITIGAGTVQYPLVRCNGIPVTQEYLGQGYVYPVRVQTTATSAIFKVLCDLNCVSPNLPSIPVATAAAGVAGGE